MSYFGANMSFFKVNYQLYNVLHFDVEIFLLFKVQLCYVELYCSYSFTV